MTRNNSKSYPYFNWDQKKILQKNYSFVLAELDPRLHYYSGLAW